MSVYHVLIFSIQDYSNLTETVNIKFTLTAVVTSVMANTFIESHYVFTS
jgi:hypothetical protein